MNAVAIEVQDMPEYDGRRSNAMSAERKRLDNLLARWAVCWMTAYAALGYPRQSIYVRIGELGTRVANEFTGVLQMPDDLMRVDKAILQLRPVRRQVVIRRYVYFVSLEQAARDCNMSLSRYRKVLDSACSTLEDLLQDLISASNRDFL